MKGHKYKILMPLALSLRLKFAGICPCGSLPKLKAQIIVSKITGVVKTLSMQYLLRFYCCHNLHGGIICGALFSGYHLVGYYDGRPSVKNCIARLVYNQYYRVVFAK